MNRPRPSVSILELSKLSDFGMHLAPAPEVWEWLQAEILADTGSIHNEDHAHLLDADIQVMWASSSFSKQGRTVLGQAEQVAFRAGGWQKARMEQQMVGGGLILGVNQPEYQGHEDAMYSDLFLHIMPRGMAKTLGQRFYFSGAPCKHGHASWRSTGSSNCVQCLSEYRRRPEVKEKVAQANRVRKADPAIREQLRASKREYHRRNRESELHKMKARNKAYYESNGERIRAQVRQYQTENTESRRAYKAAWERQALVLRPEYAAIVSMRKLVARVCERISVGRRALGRTTAELGYSTEEFKDHIERQFLPGMSWSSRSEWHIDHIIPLASFDLTDPDERRAANALTNLRPIWAADNLQKSDRIMSLL
jgi:Putative phage metallopeptidase